MTSQLDRTNKLKLLLSKQHDYVTAEELASLMNTSTKTVYRLVKKINEKFSGGKLILSEKGRGYKLDYGKFIEQSEPVSKETIEVSPFERQNRVMEELLLSSPQALRIMDLFGNYYVGDSAISNDEKVIASRIKKFELKLMRKNRTLAIRGKEENIRRAIAELIQRLNIIDLDEIKSSDELNFNRYDVLFVSDQLRIIEKQLGGAIPYPYNVNIFSHLYIMISRSRKLNHQLSGEKLTNEQLLALDDSPKIRDIATEVIRNVEAYLVTKLPVSEIYYLYQYLLSSRMENVSDKIQTFSPEVEVITNYFLSEVGKRLNINATNESIFVDLANHIKPMLNRLKNKIRVKNGLLEQIQLTYESIFHFVSEVAEEVSEKFNLPAINQDEIGFITLYFARMIETHQLPIQTLIMCTTGVGTSELLKAKVAKKFPELNVVDVIATKNYQLALKKTPGIELILTTIGMKDLLPVNSLLVSAMLTVDDQTRIQKKIEEIYNER
ncbi:PRD domain-containing protein [Enterococcus durans]|uniref:BglG family transcription antiterminator n=1 Tax=Enterococcus durans TaxID=53345 RepID=UPI00232FA54A|nr:PRD domain-containing protein [Enterococcus durans]MDB1652172.1 PRD domain-containing protein [Enterococcus durans]MDB1663113.1 PRD domain-containing protein [Enterococcus durans]MDB1668258.1 PRD domain-containing protein [Enterococcus durans]MDB1670319.1 PRD domain-containing protein [Enterococcus durans]MDB1673963.1 PRD domain-containing protein [Enterococcus durans]